MGGRNNCIFFGNCSIGAIIFPSIQRKISWKASFYAASKAKKDNYYKKKVCGDIRSSVKPLAYTPDEILEREFQAFFEEIGSKNGITNGINCMPKLWGGSSFAIIGGAIGLRVRGSRKKVWDLGLVARVFLLNIW